MRILLIAEAPWKQTGYGQPVKQIADMWAELGHDTVVLAVGSNGPGITDFGKTPVVLAGNGDSWGQAIVEDVCNAMSANVVVSLLDPWILDPPGYGKEINGGRPWIAWMPVDQDPPQRGLDEALKCTTVALSFSEFGLKVLREHMPEAHTDYMPIPVDLKSYMTVTGPGKIKARETFGIFNSKLVIGLAGTNLPGDRKALASQVEGFCLFCETFDTDEKPILLVKSSPFVINAVDIPGLVREMGCEGQALYISPFARGYGFVDRAKVAQFYQACDVLLHASAAEGFGLQILEAMACGTDVIYAVNSSMPEVAGECGFPVYDTLREWSIFSGWWHRPTADGVCQALRDWRFNRDKYGPDVLRKNAERYSADLIAPRWADLLGKIERGEL